MNISLDYDDTYTRDPALWDAFIEQARKQGHKVFCVTMRYPHWSESKPVFESLTGKVDDFFFTGRKAKRPFMYQQRINIDVWIDDQPNWIVTDALA